MQTRPGVRDERGAALVLALMVLVGLATLVLALLSIGASEPQISRNHVDMLRARYLAEAGVEHAYEMLARNIGSWNSYLTGATCTTGTVLTQSTVSELASESGKFTVRVRNDCEPGDDRITGVPVDDGGDAESDTNGTVIVASTGRVGSTVHTVAVVMSRGGTPRSTPGQTGPQAMLTAHSWADQ
jgi:Tfp pilus assembly protein PilX